MASNVIELYNLLRSNWVETDPAWSDFKIILNETDQEPDYPNLTIREARGMGGGVNVRMLSPNVWRYENSYEVVCSFKAVKGESTIGDAKKQRENTLNEIDRIIRHNHDYIDRSLILPAGYYIPSLERRGEPMVKAVYQINIISYSSNKE